MNEIEIEAEYTVDDYARALTYIQNRTFNFKFLLNFALIAFPLFLAILFLAAYTLDPLETIELIKVNVMYFLIFAVILVLLKYLPDLILKWTLKRQFNSSPVLREPQTIVISDEGIYGKTILSAGENKWGAIIEAVETDKDFYFFISNKFATFIPKHFLKDEFELASLRRIVRDNLGEKAKLLTSGK